MARDLAPDLYFYWKMRAYFLCRSMALSIEWWLILTLSYYFEPDEQPGKYNGTYWMYIKADLFGIKRDIKELKYMRRRLDKLSVFAGFWNLLWGTIRLHLTMQTLNIIGILYFVARIILSKIGYLTFCVKEKFPWSKRRRRQKAKSFHVHNVALNIDKRIQDRTLNFDTDASTIICDNSANVHICNDKNSFVGPLR